MGYDVLLYLKSPACLPYFSPFCVSVIYKAPRGTAAYSADRQGAGYIESPLQLYIVKLDTAGHLGTQYSSELEVFKWLRTRGVEYKISKW